MISGLDKLYFDPAETAVDAGDTAGVPALFFFFDWRVCPVLAGLFPAEDFEDDPISSILVPIGFGRLLSGEKWKTHDAARICQLPRSSAFRRYLPRRELLCWPGEMINKH